MNSLGCDIQVIASRSMPPRFLRASVQQFAFVHDFGQEKPEIGQRFICEIHTMVNSIHGSISPARHNENNTDSGVIGSTVKIPRTEEGAYGALQIFQNCPQALPRFEHALAPRRQSFPGMLPDKTGGCASKPDTDSSSTASSSTDFPVRHSTSVFDYITAELSKANVDGICVGLTAQWLLSLDNGASDRMTALTPGSERHAVAAAQQQQYQDLKCSLIHQGAGSAEADLRAQNTMFNEAGLAPSEEVKTYKFGNPSSLSRLLENITQESSKHLLSLYFADGDAHIVATSVSNGMITLFDPNYGEFTARSNATESLLQSLSNRYRHPNMKYLSTITTQKIS